MLKHFLVVIFLLLPYSAFADEFVAGKDYEIMNQITESPEPNNKVSVLEFFSYGCPWCYRIELTLMNWVKQQNDTLQFSRIPVVFNKDWTYYAKAYYTAHLLGREAQLTPLLFKTIQAREHTMNSNQAMIDFFIAQGVEPNTAKSTFENSTTIDLQLKQSNALMARYHINGVPAIIINNQYKTDLQMAKSEARLVKILDFLVAKAHNKVSN